ncbi:hypothetical protein WM42_2029 [Corynebacterium simulans]|nr:hypothetical protein WM42_2029 [Corynebacterium simulans]
MALRFTKEGAGRRPDHAPVELGAVSVWPAVLPSPTLINDVCVAGD